MTARRAPALDTDDHRALLAVAEDAIAEVLSTGARLEIDAARYPPPLRARGATFVTLERDDALLGCIGTIDPVRSLVADVEHNAVAAAFADPRLPSIDHDDWEVMQVEVSVLSALEPLAAASLDELADELRPGTDGLLVEAPRRRATFLPAVWRHFGDDVGAFVDALWHKAGLVPGSWPEGTRCSRYTTAQLAGDGPRPRVTRAAPRV